MSPWRRLALWESVLIKDNHLYALRRLGVKDPIAASLGKAWKKRKLANFIEIEVATMKEALHAAEVMRKLRKPGDAGLVLFANMNPRQMKRTLEELERKHL